jgi:hypothetical protein
VLLNFYTLIVEHLLFLLEDVDGILKAAQLALLLLVLIAQILEVRDWIDMLRNQLLDSSPNLLVSFALLKLTRVFVFKLFKFVRQNLHLRAHLSLHLIYDLKISLILLLLCLQRLLQVQVSTLRFYQLLLLRVCILIHLRLHFLKFSHFLINQFLLSFITLLQLHILNFGIFQFFLHNSESVLLICIS